MRIEFEQSGGFAGLVKGCRIDTASLPPDERRTLEALVAESGFGGSCTLVSAAGRDLRQYEIRIHGDDIAACVRCDERSVPEAARPLVRMLAARAVPQAPTRERGDAVDGDVWGRFVGTVVARWADDGRTMTLVEPFAYEDPRGERWDAPQGAVIDGASIPRGFWSLVGGPFEGRFRNASVVHDVACERRDRPWPDVHRMFYEACRCGGVGAVIAKTMYFAVQHFGPRWSVEERTTIVAGRFVTERTVRDDTPAPAPAGTAELVHAYFEAHDIDADAIPGLSIPGLPQNSPAR